MTGSKLTGSTPRRARGRALCALGAALLALALLAGPASLRTAFARPIDDVEGAFRAGASERDIARILPGRRETERFLFQFRPGGSAEKGLAALEKALVAGYQKACARLEWSPVKKARVYVYDSASEMTRMTGRPGDEAAVLGGALHLACEGARFAGALSRLAEPEWGRAGEKLGVGLEGGRWYRLKVAARAGRLSVSIDDRALTEIPLPGAAGAVGFGVEEGRLAVRVLKVRTPAPDADTAPPWSFPLRPPLEKAWKPEVAGRSKIADEELDIVNYGRMTRTLAGIPPAKDVELECELRLSEGALGEVTLHAAGTTATRLCFGPGAIFVRTAEGRRPLVGPFPTLREGLAEALAAEVEGTSIHALARACMDQGLAPARELVRSGMPSASGERKRRQVLLGSLVAYAIETHGAAKYRDLHFADLQAGPTPIGDVAQVEAEWRKFLAAKTFEGDETAKARRRLGLDLLADASKWRDLQEALPRLRSEGGGASRVVDGVLEWTAPGAGQKGKIALPEPCAAKASLRAGIRLGEGSRARLSVQDREGRVSAALLSLGGAQLVTPDSTVAAKGEGALTADRWYEAVLVLEGSAGRLYLDGVLVAEAKEGLSAGPGKAFIEVEGRKVELRAPGVRTGD